MASETEKSQLKGNIEKTTVESTGSTGPLSTQEALLKEQQNHTREIYTSVPHTLIDKWD